MNASAPSLKSRLKAVTRVTPETLARPFGRAWALTCYTLFDQGFLRILWTNLEEIAPGVWRSNQPGPRRVARYARMGIKTILVLRGVGEEAHFQLEKDACARHGIALEVVTLNVTKAFPASRFLTLLETFRAIEGPFLMHCKSGSDRAGLASALYLLDQGRPVAEARKMLSLRYLHLSNSDAGILDVMLDHFEEEQAEGPVTLEDWLKTSYDPVRLTEDFKAGRRHGKPWPR